MDVVFDEAAARILKEEEWWFESEDGYTLKWCALSFTSRAPNSPPPYIDRLYPA